MLISQEHVCWSRRAMRGLLLATCLGPSGQEVELGEGTVEDCGTNAQA